MQIPQVALTLLWRSLMLQAAGAALAVGGAAYYFTHPQRIVSELPESLRHDAHSVSVTANDGALLHGTWIPGRGPDGGPFDRTIVHHHGYNSTGGVLLARRALFQRTAAPLLWSEQRAPLTAWPLVAEGLQRGFNFLLIDARAHGESGGTWDPTGVQAVSDAVLWARWLRETHTQLWAGLWGNSFGAAVGLGLAVLASGGGYDAMVLDSPVVVSDGVYAGAVLAPFYATIRPVIRRLGNPELYPALLARKPWMPILLIHGTEDRHVPAWQSQRVFELIQDARQPERAGLWLVQSAEHLQSFEVAPEEYTRRTLDWFDRWM